MLPFALSIFTGAFLLFQVQPLIGKYILPWFGGSPGVWTTCLLFFQTLLLGGYAYAHLSSKFLKPRGQTVLHLALLLLALAFLPITPAESWKSHLNGNPTLHILLLLTATIGLPYFVLSATGPLMQQWFTVTRPGVSPYRLYALSNIGSLLALLSYPIFFEVKFSRHEQAVMWSLGLGGFVLLAAWSARQVWCSTPATTPAPADTATTPTDEPAPLWRDQLLWIALPAIASVLLLATTNKLCQEVAVIPFLWVLPLALYLLTFVICFDHARWYHRGVFAALLAIGIACVCALLEAGTDAPMKLQIAGYSVTLFVACMICHGELYQLKPPPRKLTSYFLFISAGGALGGLLVAVVAPAIFNEYLELELGFIALGLAFVALCFRHHSRTLALGAIAGALLATLAVPALASTFEGSDGLLAEFLKFYRSHAVVLGCALVTVLACLFDFRHGRSVTGWRYSLGLPVTFLAIGLGYTFVRQITAVEPVAVLRASRNFYGTLKVLNYSPLDPSDNYHLLMHGATTHGLQFVAPERAFIPTSYYGARSGVGLALTHFTDQGKKRVGVVGLGTGSLAAYGRAGDTLRLYEINPAVARLARDPFTYLAQCPAQVDVVMGDARLEMERELAAGQVQAFDVLALDAFSSDAIPVHLLTQEAFATYLKHLKPGGVIAIHISNRYLDLQPVVERLAQHFGLATACISDDTEEDWWVYSTTWMLVTKDRALLARSEIAAGTTAPTKATRPAALWTDDNANLYSIMK
ncbi:MAG: fused MFS/spermidine synthase [Undibacterium sp.]|nr:fused MFS/spermidine synthase [Opitutaceae bacterium]